MQQTRLCLKAHDELFIIDLPRVLYMQADDHYAHIYYTSGGHFMVPQGLARIEALMAELDADTSYMVRMGRKYIVNVSRIFRVSTVREQLFLADDHGSNVTLHIPKNILRQYLDQLDATLYPKDTQV
ncbi:MAG: LytTR family transcriptional regulator [Prevotella sp.]|nr:LytTR family transcriptional regulator [Prevotella sp.]